MIYSLKKFAELSGFKINEIKRYITQGIFIENLHYKKVSERKIIFDENALTIANIVKEQNVKNLQERSDLICRLHNNKRGASKTINGLKGYIREQKVS